MDLRVDMEWPLGEAKVGGHGVATGCRCRYGEWACGGHWVQEWRVGMRWLLGAGMASGHAVATGCRYNGAGMASGHGVVNGGKCIEWPLGADVVCAGGENGRLLVQVWWI